MHCSDEVVLATNLDGAEVLLAVLGIDGGASRCVEDYDSRCSGWKLKFGYTSSLRDGKLGLSPIVELDLVEPRMG